MHDREQLVDRNRLLRKPRLPRWMLGFVELVVVGRGTGGEHYDQAE
jgi:hypothetical protein